MVDQRDDSATLIGSHDAHQTGTQQVHAASMETMAEAIQAVPVQALEGTAAEVLTLLRADIAAGEGGHTASKGDFGITEEVQFYIQVAKHLYQKNMPPESVAALQGTNKVEDEKALTLCMFDLAIKLAEQRPVYPTLA